MIQRPVIVAINDDPLQLHLITNMLEGAGYEVSSYLDSSKALNELREGMRVDAFAVDLHMPGIDGWKVCRMLRSPEYETYNGTPILVVSATFTGADVEAITTDIGANAFLPVPFSRDDLLYHLRELLAGMRPNLRPTVLLVDDDETVLGLLTQAFTTHGYDVTSVSSLAEGRSEWSRLTPELVVLDYHLPDGDGLDLIEQLHSPSERTVVLVATGDGDPNLPIRLMEAGADAYIRKPFDPHFVVEMAGKARRERSLLRVEALLERRTQELRRSDERYRSLFEAIPDIVLTVDIDDRVAGANYRAVEFLGSSLASLEGKSITTFVGEQDIDSVSAGLREVRSRGSARFEAVLRGSGGSTRTVEVTASAAEAADPGALVLVARDLTERRKAEEERRRLDAQVQHAQRLESLGVLAGGIAHDFNNLLVGVLGNASLAMLDTQEGTGLHECVTQIETAARRAAELTQQILTFSGKGETAMAPLDLSGMVSEMGQLVTPAISMKAALEYRLDEGLPGVHADASQLRQVVMNLIINASDALGGEPGRIEVSTALRELSAHELADFHLGERAEAGRYVMLQVSDDGCGMDDETRRQMFDPFFTTKFAGRGLGLAATLGIVRTHGGLLSVRSKAGEGTRFRVLLPALQNRVEREGDQPTAKTLPIHGGTILVIDDEPAVRSLAAKALSRSGYDILQADGGRPGLDIVLDGDEGAVDLILLDLTMPHMGGDEVLRILREQGLDIPVLLSSGYLGNKLPRGTLEPGRTEFLRKPYSPRQLVEAITMLLSDARRRKRTRSELKASG